MSLPPLSLWLCPGLRPGEIHEPPYSFGSGGVTRCALRSQARANKQRAEGPKRTLRPAPVPCLASDCHKRALKRVCASLGQGRAEPLRALALLPSPGPRGLTVRPAFSGRHRGAGEQLEA